MWYPVMPGALRFVLLLSGEHIWFYLMLYIYIIEAHFALPN